MSTVELGFSAGFIEELQLYNSHRHNDIELNFLSSGELVYAFAGREYYLPANRLAVFWAAIPHRLIRIAPKTALYWITIPVSLFTNWDLPNGVVRSILNADFLQDQGHEAVTLDPYRLRQWYEDILGGSETHGKTVLLEIEARLRRLSLSLHTGSEKPPLIMLGPGNNAGLSAAHAIAAFVAQHYTEQINCQGIAAAVGIHPGYASRAFANTYHIGIVDYLTQYRVAAAQKLLLMTDLPVKHIAFEAGFNSLSRFHASFKKLCGFSPEKYRQLLTSAAKD